MSENNLVQLKPSEIKDMIKQRWRKRDTKTRPICIVGHKGVGKSDIVRQVAKELAEETGLDVTCRTINLQFCEPPDFLGLPVVRDHEKYGEQTKHARPEVLPDDTNDDGTWAGGIWFMDEANRCSRDNRAGMLTLIQDRQVNGHKLGSNWIIVMAMNPSTDINGVAYETQEFDAALQDRIAEVFFRGDYSEFLGYMTRKHTDENAVVQWIMNQSDVVDFDGKRRTSPRGLDYLADALKVTGGNPADNFNTIAAEVGVEAAHAFMKFLSDVETVRPEEIVYKFNDGVKAKLKKLESLGRHDVVNTLVRNVCVYISANFAKLGKAEMDNIGQYVSTISADAKAAFFLELGKPPMSLEIFSAVNQHLRNFPEIVQFLKAAKAIEDKRKR